MTSNTAVHGSVCFADTLPVFPCTFVTTATHRQQHEPASGCLTALVTRTTHSLVRQTMRPHAAHHACQVHLAPVPCLLTSEPLRQSAIHGSLQAVLGGHGKQSRAGCTAWHTEVFLPDLLQDECGTLESRDAYMAELVALFNGLSLQNVEI